MYSHIIFEKKSKVVSKGRLINCCGEVVEGVIQQIMESLINLTPLVWLDNSFLGMVGILRLIEFHGHMVSN